MSEAPLPRRVSVVGNSGSGKTRMSRQVASIMGVPLLELDALQHRPGWQAAPREEFRAELAAFIERCSEAGAGFVIDGNYREQAGDIITDNIDTVVWLDYPRWLVTARVVRRTAGRSVFRRKLWNGNRESLRLVLSRDPEKGIIAWSWTQFPVYRARYEAAAASTPEGGPTWVRLHTPRDARRWLRELSARSDRPTVRE